MMTYIYKGGSRNFNGIKGVAMWVPDNTCKTKFTRISGVKQETKNLPEEVRFSVCVVNPTYCSLCFLVNYFVTRFGVFF